MALQLDSILSVLRTSESKGQNPLWTTAPRNVEIVNNRNEIAMKGFLFYVKILAGYQTLGRSGNMTYIYLPLTFIEEKMLTTGSSVYSFLYSGPIDAAYSNKKIETDVSIIETEIANGNVLKTNYEMLSMLTARISNLFPLMYDTDWTTEPKNITQASMIDVTNMTNQLYVKILSTNLHTYLYLPLKFEKTQVEMVGPSEMGDVYYFKSSKFPSIVISTRAASMKRNVDAGTIFKVVDRVYPTIGVGTSLVAPRSAVASSAIAANSRTERENAYIFDFDCTLTARHFFAFVNGYNKFIEMYYTPTTYFSMIAPELRINFTKYFKGEIESIPARDDSHKQELKKLLIETIFGDEERIELLKSLFESVGRDNLYIASRGIKEQIIRLLNYVGLPVADNSESSGLILSENITGNETPKEKVMERLLNAGKNVFYADDDKTEYSKFIKENTEHLTKPVDDGSIITYRYKLGNFYKFYTKLSKDGFGGIPEEDLKRLTTMAFPMMGGSTNSNYHQKYLKYKAKYMKLKNFNY